jgi:23S rRNA (adenine2503-C2)-methyltransferase
VVDRYEVTREGLAELLAGEPSYRVEQLWRGLYEDLATPGEVTTLPLELRGRLEVELPSSLHVVAERTGDAGETTNWLFALSGGARVETVLMAYDDRVTACVSSQAGCAMGCTFCATGQAGYERNLSVGEIVEQVVVAARAARPRRLSNVVFMGMGEPLANYDRVWAAVHRLHDDLGLSARHLTVSTVGIVPGILRLAEADLPVNLAVSLHAANDVSRNELVPINRRYPIAELSRACSRYVEATGRRLSIEWALIDGVNDTELAARELAAFALPLRAHVNLIPLNPTPGYLVRGSGPDQVRAFADDLRGLGVNATVRRTRGVEIDAACGQLAAGHPVSLSRRRPERGAAAAIHGEPC